MSWQQKAVVPVTCDDQDDKTTDSRNEMTGDSRILQYIKTLTHHHMNAKQQRMDRYLQQVKHTKPVKDFSVTRLSKPLQYPSTSGMQHQPMDKKLQSKVKSRRTTKGWKNDRAHVATTTRSRSKRPHGKSQEYRQLKSKQAQHITASESLDRFRLHGAWSHKSKTSVDEEYSSNRIHHDPTGNKYVQPVERQQQPQAASTGFSTISTDRERRPVQEVKRHSAKTQAALAQTQASCSSLIQPVCSQSTKEVQPRNFGYDYLSQQEDFIPTYDPLVTIMESIYF
ncbi:unnamed protein product [Peronospora belbahrii]|uniref:Uncharacterized protein n=1 Tax=Peronospora belbahrii TaxID=622444 RepID=A0AAU9KJE1_9STRA|nr:unnamed protein product [Peronospora belbahrii]